MRRIELGDFLLIAEIHTGINAHQLARLPRVTQLASAALAAPFAGFGDFEAHPTLHEKAAVYCSRIVTYHPLPDGNKRTGYDVMREFIERNDGAFTHPPGGLDATAKAVEELAAGTLSETDFVSWVGKRLYASRRITVVASYPADTQDRLISVLADMRRGPEVPDGIPHFETAAVDWSIEEDARIPPRRQTLAVIYEAETLDEDGAKRFALDAFTEESQRAGLPKPETVIAHVA